MSDDVAKQSPTGEPSASTERVAQAMARIEAGARQRLAERAAAGGGGEGARQRLVELSRLEYIQDPVPVSPRPVYGRWIVFVRKAVYHLFLKWHARGVLDQQNAYNRQVSALLKEILEDQERTAAGVSRLAQRLELMEERVAELEAREVRSESGDPGS